MKAKYIIGLDEGTTSVRTVLYDTQLNKIVHIEQIKFNQIYPAPSWVEQNAEQIWQLMQKTLNTTIKLFHLDTSQIHGIAITNQRETIVAFDKKTGKPICNALGWQCKRTAQICKTIKNKSSIKAKTGLIVDAYFSATKMQWLINHNKDVREHLKAGTLGFATMDAFLLYKLTGGKSFYTDITNASRTMLFNIHTKQWDDGLLKQFGVPKQTLPAVQENCYNFGLAHTIIGDVPVLSMIGDQQASLMGQGCYLKGMAKNTYGTGCFLLMNTGSEVVNKKSLLSTVACSVNGKTMYALEGSVFNAGGALEWGNRLGLFKNSKETSDLAQTVPDNGGVYMIPAFSGLGAPHWNSKAKGIIYGITGGTSKAHISRAILESIAYSTYDIVKAMERQNIKIKELRCDGGVSKNDFLMHFQSNLIRTKLVRQSSIECTVLGAIYLAGITCGVYKNFEDVQKLITFSSEFLPTEPESKMQPLLKEWHSALKRV